MNDSRGCRDTSISLAGAAIASQNINIGSGNKIETASAASGEVESDKDIDRPLTFLSYCRADTITVLQVSEALVAEGIPVWFDRSEIRAGDVWRDETTNAIDKATSFLAILSTNSEARSWSEQRAEIVMASAARRIRLGLLIPVRLSDCSVPAIPVGPDNERLSDLHRVDLFPNFQAGIDQIVIAVNAANRRGISG